MNKPMRLPGVKLEKTGIDQRIAARLRAARIERRLTMNQVASHIGFSYQQLQKYEKGTNRITAALLTRLARHYGRPIDWFYDDQAAVIDQPDLGARFLATATGREMATAWLAISSQDDRYAILLLARRLAERPPLAEKPLAVAEAAE